MPTSPVSERLLLRRYQRDGDLAARERLVASMMPLVHSVVARYHHARHEEDLVQAASLGLAKAIERFDATRGVELRSYAIPTMHGEVRRWLRDHAWAVHMPRPLQERVLAVTAATDRLAADSGRSPAPQQVAAHLDMELEDVLEAIQAGRAYGATSMDLPLGDGDEAATLGDMLGREDDRLERAEKIAMLSRTRGVLSEQEAEIMGLRFVDDLTQAQIAERVGCSQMQVSRILHRCLDRLAEAAEQPRSAAATDGRTKVALHR